MRNSTNTLSPPRWRPPFWESLADWGDELALLDVRDGVRMSYRDLALAVDMVARRLARRDKHLVLLGIENSIDSIVALLAVLRAGHSVFLLDRTAPAAAVHRLIQTYRPDMLIWRDGPLPVEARWACPSALYGHLLEATAKAGPEAGLHDDLALVLSTSGSVGSPKAVRLSAASLAINARQIVDALSIQPGRRAALSLPLAYTYGLSVLTSHLSAGAALATQRLSVLDPLFWRNLAEAQIDTLPAVTFTLDLMAGSRWPDLRPPSLKRITHSGSRLSTKAAAWLQAEAGNRALEVFKMYGMTEAAARLSVLAPEDFLVHPDSVGRAVSGGAFEIDANGQIIYRGPNVMMGYADSRADLALGDELHGRLETGDVGTLDGEGRLQITGRLRRFAKVLGMRLNLTDMEHYLSHAAETAIVSDDLRLVIYHTLAEAEPVAELTADFCAEFKLPPQTVVWRRLDRLPRSDSGKILYGQLSG